MSEVEWTRPQDAASMRVWLLNPYGALPGEGWREYRFSFLARALAARGHTVTWWTADFSHFSKARRATDRVLLESEGRAEARTIVTPQYRRHVGLSRLAFELGFYRNAIRRLRGEERPDLVVAAEPFLASSAGASLARRHRVPLVIDVLDLWPELFATALPRPLRNAGRKLFAPLYALRKRNLRRADAVVTVCQTYTRLVEHEINAEAPRVHTVYLGSAPAPDDPSELLPCVLPPKVPGEIWGCYAGTLGQKYDISTLIDVALQLTNEDRPVRILIAGAGPWAREVAKAAETASRLVWLGMLPVPSLDAMLKRCDFGIAPYASDSTVAMPIKAYDYLAAGLPVLTSLRGELSELLTTENCGMMYEAEDPASLRAAIERLVLEPAALAERSTNARGVAARFDAEREYARYARILEEVVGGRGQGAVS
jgi:glycosyltransferase involved in cell wall biosynthesis